MANALKRLEDHVRGEAKANFSNPRKVAKGLTDYIKDLQRMKRIPTKLPNMVVTLKDRTNNAETFYVLEVTIGPLTFIRYSTEDSYTQKSKYHGWACSNTRRNR